MSRQEAKPSYDGADYASCQSRDGGCRPGRAPAITRKRVSIRAGCSGPAQRIYAESRAKVAQVRNSAYREIVDVTHGGISVDSLAEQASTNAFKGMNVAGSWTARAYGPSGLEAPSCN
jgi:hypothetical protein